MTREEAIKILKDCELNPCVSKDKEAANMAIKALEQESVLDKIKAEIEQRTDTSRTKKAMRTTFNNINEICSEIVEHKEQELAEMITKYDFIVGSRECKHKLMEVLPEGANIICTPYIESPNTIYAIKKFDVMDLLSEPF